MKDENDNHGKDVIIERNSCIHNEETNKTPSNKALWRHVQWSISAANDNHRSLSLVIVLLRILEIKSKIVTKSTCTGAGRTNLWFAHYCKLGLQLTELILFPQVNIANQFQKWFRILKDLKFSARSTARDRHKSSPVNVIHYRTHINLSRVLQIVLTYWSGVTSQDSLEYLTFPRFVSYVWNAHHKTQNNWNWK